MPAMHNSPARPVNWSASMVPTLEQEAASATFPASLDCAATTSVPTTATATQRDSASATSSPGSKVPSATSTAVQAGLKTAQHTARATKRSTSASASPGGKGQPVKHLNVSVTRRAAASTLHANWAQEKKNRDASAVRFLSWATPAS